MNKSLTFFKSMVSLCLLLWAFDSMAQTKNTWVSGSNAINQQGTYGTQGVGSTSNIPGARYASISWNVNDTLWLFGGYGYDGSGNTGYLNDLWKFNKVTGEWTWVSGSNTRDQQGTYGTQGVGSTSNIPGARYYSISWSVNDTLWLFGGDGYDGAGNVGYLNDLWKFNKVTQEWTWVSGGNARNQQGTYGTQGVGSTSNIPGARRISISWTVNDTLWLFGGDGRDGAGNFGRLNDLWKFNKVTQEWTWVSGSTTNGQQGTYGTQGVGNTSNIPGARLGSISWTVNDTLWLFGGSGTDGAGSSGILNDLWKFNKVTGEWIWVAGSNTIDQQSTYGTKGVGSTNNIPGARLNSISWSVNDTLWLFGGNGFNGTGTPGRLNDLWKFNKVTQEWTWVAGTNALYQNGSYGTQGVGSASNIPGARQGSISWTVNDTLWLFGGSGTDGSVNLNQGHLNDLWALRTSCDAAQITTDPFDAALCAGGDTLFGSLATGDDIVYKWQINQGSGWSVLGGETNDTLRLNAVTTSQNGYQYRAAIAGLCGLDTTSIVTLTVNTTTSVNLEPLDAVVCDGLDTLFALNTAGTDTSFQWQINTGSGWSDVGGETNDTILINAVNTSQNGNLYRAKVAGICGLDTTNIVTLTVNTTTSVNMEPLDALLCEELDTLFALNTAGKDTSFQWQINTGSGWSDVGGETNDTILLNAVNTSQNGNLYRATVSGTCGLDTTNIVTLTVYGNPSITNINSSRNPTINGYAPYQCANLTATVTGGTGTLNYTWSPSGSGNPLNVCPTVGTWYKATVTDANGCMDTMSFKQTVIEATSPYPGRVIMCYNYPRRAPMNIHIYPFTVPQYLNAGATLGKCGSSPSKRNMISTYDDIYRIYPNPTNSQITLEWFTLFNEEVTIELADMTGRVVQHIFNGQVLEGEINLITADLTELPVGMYFMRYTSPTDVRINKVQLMR